MSDIPQAESEVQLKLVLNLADPTQKATFLLMQAAQYVFMAEITGTSINARQKQISNTPRKGNPIYEAKNSA